MEESINERSHSTASSVVIILKSQICRVYADNISAWLVLETAGNGLKAGLLGTPRVMFVCRYCQAADFCMSTSQARQIAKGRP